MKDDAPIGMIAGHGMLPRLEAAGMRAAGRRIACIGLAGQYDEALPDQCDRFAGVGLLRIGKWARQLRRWGACEAVMVGGVSKANQYDPLRLVRRVPDWRAVRLWYRVLRHDRRDQAVLTAVADELGRCGVRLIDTTRYIPDHLATRGTMGTCHPTDAQRGDIGFGLPILDRLNALDVGQALAIKGRDVVAVEAIEGTDVMIRRAGQLCRSKGWVLLKGAGSNKDMRFDVPTVGVATIEALAAAGGGCLALVAGRVILVDKPAVLAAADQVGVAVVGVEVGEHPGG